MNKITIIGNLTKDVELSTTPNGKSVAKMTVAVGRRFNREETDFFNVTVWNELAENCSKFLSKGKKVAVDGRMESHSYEVDGSKRLAWDLTAEEVEFLSPKSDGAENGADGSKSQGNANGTGNMKGGQAHEQEFGKDGKVRPKLEEIADTDDLPF